MRHFIKLQILLISLLTLISCEKNFDQEASLSTLSEYNFARDYINTHSEIEIPLDAAFLIEREFFHTNPDTSNGDQLIVLFQIYLEQRVTDLYPSLVYDDFLDDQIYLQHQHEVVIDFIDPFTSDIDTLDFTESNFNSSINEVFNQYNLSDSTLANPGKYYIQLDSLANYNVSNSSVTTLTQLESLRANHAPLTFGYYKQEIAPATIAVGAVALYVIIKVGQTMYNRSVALGELLSKEALYNTRSEFGLSLSNSDRTNVIDNPADACYHMTACVYYRMAYGKAITRYKMQHREKKSSNKCSSAHMDLHNNPIGFKHRYKKFRDKSNLGRTQKVEMCSNVYDWVVDGSLLNPNNGVFKNWLNTYSGCYYGDACCDACADDEDNTDNKKYVYLQN
jgi:hypothetical protein